MGYNSKTAIQIPGSTGVQGQTSNMYGWQNSPFSQNQIADPYAGVEYTGSQNFTPDAANPSDYWNEQTSGYGEMPQYDPNSPYQPVDVTQNYQPSWIDPEMAGWDNANTYAPWSNPNGPGGVESNNQNELMRDPSFWAGGGHTAGYTNSFLQDRVSNIPGETDPQGISGNSASVLADMYNQGEGLFKYDPLGRTLFGGSKKRQSLTYKQPSYQGYMFTPQEGFAKWYNPSQETQDSQATQQSMYSQPQSYGGFEAPQAATQPASYDYNYSGGGSTPASGQQSFVGQQDANYGSLYGTNDASGSLYDTFKAGA